MNTIYIDPSENFDPLIQLLIPSTSNHLQYCQYCCNITKQILKIRSRELTIGTEKEPIVFFER
jgi:ribosomal protein S26